MLHTYDEEEREANDGELGYISFNIKGKRYTPPLSLIDDVFSFKKEKKFD